MGISTLLSGVTKFWGNYGKWILIAAAFAAVSIAVNKVVNYHFDQIEFAVNAAKVDLIMEQNEIQQEIREELKQQSREEKEKIEIKLKVERIKVSNLQRMLLVDHDLDKLLQKKPGLILTRVNKGTEEYYKALEELTQ